MNTTPVIRRPRLARHARYRWDALRQKHQIVFPEGVLVLNESGAAIVRHCDGRPIGEIIAALKDQFKDAPVETDVSAFLDRLFEKGLVFDAPDDDLLLKNDVKSREPRMNANERK
jgi:pyrroloquinoline quinone biosynthesis protein D